MNYYAIIIAYNHSTLLLDNNNHGFPLHENLIKNFSNTNSDIGHTWITTQKRLYYSLSRLKEYVNIYYTFK